jgi:hypothetical protein
MSIQNGFIKGIFHILAFYSQKFNFYIWNRVLFPSMERGEDIPGEGGGQILSSPLSRDVLPPLQGCKKYTKVE